MNERFEKMVDQVLKYKPEPVGKKAKKLKTSSKSKKKARKATSTE